LYPNAQDAFFSLDGYTTGNIRRFSPNKYLTLKMFFFLLVHGQHNSKSRGQGGFLSTLMEATTFLKRKVTTSNKLTTLTRNYCNNLNKPSYAQLKGCKTIVNDKNSLDG
jgi:hypothetical protein